MEPLLAPEGDVVAEHKATLTNRIAAVIFLLLPGLALAAAATRLDRSEAEARLPMLAGAAVLLALGALAIVQQNRSRVVLRADGVERWGLRGKLWALRWADMKELRYRVVKVRVGGLLGLLLPALGTNTYLAVTDPNGKTCKLPINLKGMDVLAERVAEQQTTAHYAGARTQLDHGEPVRFGKSLVLDREQISVRKLFGGMKSCPLGEIEKFVVEGGALRIRQRGKTLAFARMQTGSIPNVFLLLRLLDSLVGQKAAALGQDRDFAGQAYVG